MNEVQNFLFEGLGIRGSIIRLKETWRQVIAQHEYPQDILQLLGESVAATVLLATGLRDTPKLSLQLQGDGPVKLLLTQCSGELKVRGMVQWREAVQDEPLLGQGNLTVNIDTGEEGRTFQGTVPLISTKLDACLEAYFQQSEQLTTHLTLMVTETCIAGLLLQKLPSNDESDEMFDAALAHTAQFCTTGLSELPADHLLPRLFHNFTIRLFEARSVKHDCRCTPNHLAGIVRMLGPDEIASIIEDTGQVELTCEFCNRIFSFDATEIRKILGSEIPDLIMH